jgi:Outer membrane protein beta-barrel domain
MLLAVLCGFFLATSIAHAQQGDAMLGFGTVLSSGSTACSIVTGSCTIPEKGGLYMNLGADVIFHKRLGLAFDANWRASQGDYAGLGIPYRPLLFDFNGVYQPKISKKVGADLFAGIGWQSTRFYGYTPTSNCVYFGACYTSSNHFLIDVGAGIRYYVWGHVFVRPEIRAYHIVNNTADFSSNNIFRVGASIGYTIGPE